MNNGISINNNNPDIINSGMNNSMNNSSHTNITINNSIDTNINDNDIDIINNDNDIGININITNSDNNITCSDIAPTATQWLHPPAPAGAGGHHEEVAQLHLVMVVTSR